MTSSNLVSIIKIRSDSDLQEIKIGLIEGLNLIGGLGNFIKAGEKVVLKPNLAVGNPLGSTSPLLVESLIEEIKKIGAIPVVADGSSKSVDYDTISVAKTIGLYDIIKKHDVEFVDLDNTKTIRTKVPNGKAFKYLNVPEVIVKADKIINIPKIKTHHLTGITCAIKNLQGIVSGYEKLMTHALGLHQPLADLPKVFKCDLTIIDGLCGMEGIGPFYGEPVQLGLIIASDNILAADFVACEVMGADYSRIKHIKLCFDDHDFEPKKVVVAGEPIEKVKKKFKIPFPNKNYIFFHRLTTIFDRYIYKHIASFYSLSKKSIFPSISRVSGVHLRINKNCDQTKIDPSICPVGAIYKKSNGRYKIDLGKCVDCMKCYKELPKGTVILDGIIKSWKK
jgi:uncharacterized protein (DUF362 family)